MSDLISICKDLKSKVSERRYTHCINVGNMAKKLARCHNADEKKAYIAGILHDIAKEMTYEEQLEVLQGVNFFPPEYSRYNCKVFHGWVGSVYVKKYFGITDMDVLNAIRYHTTARKSMSTLEKIIFNADCISIERHFEGIEYFRKAAQINLDIVILDKISGAIRDSIRKRRIITRDTFEAYNDLLDNSRIHIY